MDNFISKEILTKKSEELRGKKDGRQKDICYCKNL